MITQYTITRIKQGLYIVKTREEIVKRCQSFREAANYIFTKQSEELLYGFQKTA